MHLPEVQLREVPPEEYSEFGAHSPNEPLGYLVSITVHTAEGHQLHKLDFSSRYLNLGGMIP